ncbi:MAG: L-threonylcarbamoyladenylate synthase, partial [Planctomycetaceae bacterium]|nr:L-threonylcarbamoyladenylate synthase [Planctomycetaceae bacterium]
MACRITTDPAHAAEVLRQGGLVALPTETVYGLGADATNPAAVARIFAAKQRPFFDPLIVHVSGIERVSTVARELPPLAAKLAACFWPGPLTLVLPKQPA